MFRKKGADKDLVKSTGKHPHRSRAFCEFCEFSNNIFYMQHLRGLLLSIPCECLPFF